MHTGRPRMLGFSAGSANKSCTCRYEPSCFASIPALALRTRKAGEEMAASGVGLLCPLGPSNHKFSSGTSPYLCPVHLTLTHNRTVTVY